MSDMLQSHKQDMCCAMLCYAMLLRWRLSQSV
jgi:hypothetical protein